METEGLSGGEGWLCNPFATSHGVLFDRIAPRSLTGKNCHAAETSLYETPHLCCRGHLLRMHDHTHLAPKTVPKARLHQHKTGQQPPGRTLPSLSLRTTGHLTPCSQPNPLIVHTGFVDPFCRRSSKSWGDQATKY